MLNASEARSSSGAAENTRAALQLSGFSVSYGNKRVVHDVDLQVAQGEIAVLLGHNGAGKTSTLAASLGLIKPESGSVRLVGEDVTRLPPREKVARGMVLVPADDFVFKELSVLENLELGATIVKDRTEVERRLQGTLDRWPILAERRTQPAGTLSGGQRRMLSIGMALMSGPSLMLLDEPSLGLAPNVVDGLFADLRSLADDSGIAVLLVEQSVNKALHLADHAFVLHAGRIEASEPAEEMLRRETLWDLF